MPEGNQYCALREILGCGHNREIKRGGKKQPCAAKFILQDLLEKPAEASIVSDLERLLQTAQGSCAMDGTIRAIQNSLKTERARATR